ncbi:MAG: hypothetical protein MUE67_11875 [Anaerolineales bacterium]|nr:hypothetical protein [Anaerolineales bacterium]
MEDVEKAWKMSEEAMMGFRNAEADRGIGLGLITSGSILRNQAEQWRVVNDPPATALHKTEYVDHTKRSMSTT